MANLAPSWRPKTLQNRGPNPKKSMLKKASFLASIFKGFGPCFGRVFDRFFGPQLHAKSERLIFVKTQENISFIGTEETSALLRFMLFLSKITQKLHVFWDIVFKGILGGFWDGFGRPKSMIFPIFSRKNGSKK